MTANAGLGGPQEARAGAGGSEGPLREMSLPEIAAACEAFLTVWRDPDAVSPAFGRSVRMLLAALDVPPNQPTGEPPRDKGMTPVTYWTVRCVTCGRDAFEGTDHTAWSDQDGASMTAADYYYELVDGSWYCEDHAPDDAYEAPR